MEGDRPGGRGSSRPAAALVELSLFFALSFAIARLEIWPIGAINAFFDRALGSGYNYGFLAYKAALLLAVLATIRRSLARPIAAPGRNLRALPFALACAGLALSPNCVGLIAGFGEFRPLAPERLLDIALFQIVNDGVEEITYRGYFMERADASTPSRWRIAGIPVGTSLFVSAFFFGLLHAVNPFDPFAGEMGFNASWGFSTMASGLLFGIVRSASGSLLPAIFLHAAPDILGPCVVDRGPPWPLLAMAAAAYAGIFLLASREARRIRP